MCAQVCAPPARARESARGEKRPDTPPGAVCPPTPGVGQPGQALVAELGGEEAAPGTFTSHPPGVGLPLLRDPRPRRFCAGADSAASLGLVRDAGSLPIPGPRSRKLGASRTRACSRTSSAGAPTRTGAPPSERLSPGGFAPSTRGGRGASDTPASRSLVYRLLRRPGLAELREDSHVRHVVDAQLGKSSFTCLGFPCPGWPCSLAGAQPLLLEAAGWRSQRRTLNPWASLGAE